MTLAYHKWGILHSKDLCLAYYSCVLVFKLVYSCKCTKKFQTTKQSPPYFIVF